MQGGRGRLGAMVRVPLCRGKAWFRGRMTSCNGEDDLVKRGLKDYVLGINA